MRRIFAGFFLATACLPAAQIARVVAFGDSLADNGNLYALIGYPPSPPYFNGRGSNGPVAVEHVAQLLGVPLLDFAVYGATTGLGNSIDGGTPAVSNGLPGVLAAYATAVDSGFAPAPTDLVIVMGGPANDFRASNLSPSSIAPAVANQVALISALQATGAQQIIVAGLPDLGLTPAVNALGPAVAAQASLLTAAFNSALLAALPPGATFFDTSARLHSILSNAAAYGFTNTTAACTDGVTVCAAPSQYFFWDDVHPTTRVHQLTAESLAALAAVPEPAALVLTALGLILLLARRRPAAVDRRQEGRPIIGPENPARR